MKDRAKLLQGACILLMQWLPCNGLAQSMLTSGSGSLEFTLKLHGAQPSFLKPPIIFSGASSDGNERIEAKLLGGDLIVIRDIRPCMRQSARLADAINPGSSKHIAIRWNHASAAVTVDGRSAVLEPSLADTFPPFVAGRFQPNSPEFEVREIAFNRSLGMTESAADRKFFAQARCFDPRSSTAGGTVADRHRGIELRGLTQRNQFESIKRWIDAMTAEMLPAVRSVAVTEEGAQTWRGLSIPDRRAMMLRPEVISEPRVFFHEGAHLLDGLHGWRDSHDWGVRFMQRQPGQPSFSPGAVGHMDASAPGEQLAEAVGLAKMEALGFANARMCQQDERCSDKMKFLASRGYLSPDDADAVATQRTRLQDRSLSVSKPSAATKLAAQVHHQPAPNPYYETEPIVVAPGASQIEVVLDKRYFRPIDIYHDGGRTVPPTWRGCKVDDVMNRLTKTRPAAITREPPLTSGVRKYGYFDFGLKQNRRHYLAMDELSDGSILMHFDRLGNGQLDDTLPKMGQFKEGEKGFATLIEFPWSTLMDPAPFEGSFKLWFISNPSEWAISGFTKSSRTQLLGALQLGGQSYDLIIADSALSDNDGNMTNDGLCLRKPGQKALCWKDEEARSGLTIDGRRYVFNVRLPAR